MNFKKMISYFEIIASRKSGSLDSCKMVDESPVVSPTILFAQAIVISPSTLLASAVLTAQILLVSLLILTVPTGVASAQPVWFYEADRCPDHTVGYAIYSYVYPDSSLKQAAINGAMNRSIQSRVRIEGTLAFRQSPIGTYTVKNDIIEVFDEDRAVRHYENLHVQDSFRQGNAHISLIGEGPCTASGEEISKASRSAPDWVKTPPKAEGYIYAVGISPGYHYMSNAWLDAEKDARLQLAWSLESKILADTYTSTTYREELQITDLGITLSGIEIVARYHDSRKNVHHVLVRTKSSS